MAKVNTQEQMFLHHLLIDPKFRIWRHLLLIMALGFITLNQTFISFQENVQELGYNIYLIALYSLVTDLMVIYYNIYVLIPKYLLKKKYVSYMGILLLSILLLLISQYFCEYIVRIVINDLPSIYWNLPLILNIISSFVMTTICMVGGAMTVLLKYWMTENQRMNQLEKMRIQSEVEQLKEQVNPQLLFNILDRTGVLAKTEPENASRMLLKLSQILRYQLYDCSRETVLLSAEIRFLMNYLSLQQLYFNRLEYKISSDGDVNRVFLPPLLFISFVQYAVKQVCDEKQNTSVNVYFRVENKRIDFTCYFDFENMLHDTSFLRIRQRLELLYGNTYSLSIGRGCIILNLNI